LADHFVRDLHTPLFAPIWHWGGRQRQLELNIGVAPEQIAVELRGTRHTITWRWTHTDDWTPRRLGIATHAETVRTHPFVDGNRSHHKTSR
jgi:fido (protein-threonine AMPylation protein)